MVSSRDLGELVEYVVQAEGRLVLCGDHRQLPSIRAGGGFRAVVARTDAIELCENRRQREGWERNALDTLRDGAASEAIRVYEAHDRLVIGGDRGALISRLVSDWWAAGADGRTAMIALRRADVRQLTAHARCLLREAGRLGPDVPFPCGTFAVGDRVVVRRNDRRIGVANGEAGVVEAVDDRSGLSVRIGQRHVHLPLWYLDSPATRPTVQHAYAITGHIAQGMTVERAFVLGTPELYREWGYTAMSTWSPGQPALRGGSGRSRTPGSSTRRPQPSHCTRVPRARPLDQPCTYSRARRRAQPRSPRSVIGESQAPTPRT